MQETTRIIEPTPKTTDQSLDLTSINRKKRLNKRRENRDTTTPTKTETIQEKDEVSGDEENTQDRKKKRLVRNREAAQASRERKKSMIQDLQLQITQQKLVIEQLSQKT
jgi:hypothetical protein